MKKQNKLFSRMLSLSKYGRIINGLLSITIILIFFTGCKKYEEGPMISLRKPINRIYGGWDIAKYYINGNDSTQTYKNRYTSYIEFIDNYIIQSSIPIYRMGNMFGNCGFANDKHTKLWLGKLYHPTGDSVGDFPFGANNEIIFEIKKLTNKELNIESNINNYDFRIELEKRD